MRVYAFDIPAEEELIIVEAVIGITKSNFMVQVYDFLAHGITSDYNGLLGLDFLRETKFCIDLNKGEIGVL